MHLYFLRSTAILLAIFTILTSCQEQGQQQEIKRVSDKQASLSAAQTIENSDAKPHEDLSVSIWATTELLGDPIGIDMDNSGNAWVTVTSRSNNSEFDIRGVDSSWLTASMTWETVEDRRQFLREEFALNKSDENDWLWDHNDDGRHDWRDLRVIQEEVWVLKDSSGNGMADHAELYIRDFNDEVTDVAGTVLNHNGDVFVGVGPDMWRTTDTDNDGISDWKESISHGYNVHVGFSGHGMSGATVGPGGRIYWSIGDMGFSVKDKEGKTWHYPNQGAILRSETDGTNFEVYAAGVRNTHEFVFDKYGNLITVDNDGDHDGEFERLVYLVNGSDSGWRTNWQFGKYTDDKNNDYKVWMDENYFRPRWEGQAAHVLPPLSEYYAGPAGMSYNPGTALNDQWENHFFVMSFRGSAEYSNIYAFTLEENGASYELATNQEALNGVLAVGLDFGPDGALYMTDWIRGWGQKNQGRIWKLDDVENTDSEARIQTKQLLEASFTDQSSDQLFEYLGHDDMRIRQKAQFELANRGDTSTLERAIADGNEQLARIHGIWGLAQMGRSDADAVAPLITLLDDPDHEIRSQAAKWLGDVRYTPAAESVSELLKDSHPRVRFFATEALGRMSYWKAFDQVVKMLEENNDEDVYLRHAGAIALSRFEDGEALSGLADHPSEAVRTAAVVALKRLEHPGSARYLNDNSEFVVTNAARAISDDAFVDDAMQPLASLLDNPPFTNEALMRRIINANLYVGTADEAQRLARFSADSEYSEQMRVEALRTLMHWENPSIFDRVTGRHRGQIQNEASEAREAMAIVADQLLIDPSSNIKIAAIKTSAELGITETVDRIYALVSEGNSPEVRSVALEGLQTLGYENIDDAVEIALSDYNETVRMTAIGMIPDLAISDNTAATLLIDAFNGESLQERQSAIAAFANLESESAQRFLGEQISKMADGDLPLGVHVELIETVEKSGSDRLKEQLNEYVDSKSSDGALAEYRSALRGGNAGEGARIFYNNAAAQCIRCHAVDGSGGEIGPELTSIGSRLTRETLLESMVAPSARIAPGYGVLTVTLSSGDTVRGAILGETDAYYVLSVDGDNQRIQKSMITSAETSPSSMPAMGDLLTRRQLRDLVEFMVSLEGSTDDEGEAEIESH